MKIIIAFACLLAIVRANENANVIRNEAEVNVNDFKYALELDNSVNIQQQGQLKPSEREPNEQWVVEGQHSWTSPEGEPVSIQYIANENGYQVLSANPPLPTPPPIPEAIQRALDYIRDHPSQDQQ
ncbi:cuticular protein 47Eg-like [Scaptodrosophila lebanonensis]|uniref:Cuticular protein 47Eg-like n=1 Tax=Drosophila lebanonensis TaxID=7225 RepID=A0A6J2UKF8_DROLE|nr:cuticular protein 47Eg-like [Scaptodrosophila lebanonensis]